MKLTIEISENEYLDLTTYLREHDSFIIFKKLLLQLRRAYEKR